MDLQLLLVQIHAGITVLEQVFELAEQYVFAQLDKLLGEKCNLTLSCGAYPVSEVCPLEVFVDVVIPLRIYSAITIRKQAVPSKPPTLPVLEERPGVVCVTMKELHQRVDRFQFMGHTCAVVADYLEVHHGVVRRLISSIGSAVFAMNVLTAGRNISSMKHQFNERACMRFLSFTHGFIVRAE
ncbi:hypothetical protein MRX96_010438 [Rhipicephalus microplus]